MRALKRGTILVILTTAFFLLTYIYIFHQTSYTKEILAKIVDDSRLWSPPIDSNVAKIPPIPFSAKKIEPSLDPKPAQKLQTETIKLNFTTVLPTAGLANSPLIGSFNESLSFPINWPLKCVPNNGTFLTVLIVVISGVEKRQSRAVIRQTWGGYALKRGAQLIFLTGKALEKEDQDAVIKENHQFMDIVQMNLDDVYYNMTLKTVGMVKWAYEHCRNVKFVFKTDDDMFINPELLLTYAKTRLDVRKAILGSLWPEGQPIREKGRWYVPKSLYPYPYYPTYVSGGAYLITGDAVPLLYETSLHVPTFLFEDVTMAGMVAQKAGVERINADDVISALHYEVNATCKFRELICSHNYKPKVMMELWQRLNRKDIKCFPGSAKDIKPVDRR